MKRKDWKVKELPQEDDGFILYESRAIAQYIEMKYPHKGTQGLVPKELKEYSRFLQAASIETSYFNDLAGAIVMEKIFNPYVDWIVS